jgi:hypothetical protein
MEQVDADCWNSTPTDSNFVMGMPPLFIFKNSPTAETKRFRLNLPRLIRAIGHGKTPGKPGVE